eukprot:GHVN01042867.1.p1 GENE.GHVN01042867.1~~GHVN01042867.1.p1  ORF type:complete len:266 (+),score=3.24 GHVN01042867.1:96-893(+)
MSEVHCAPVAFTGTTVEFWTIFAGITLVYGIIASIGGCVCGHFVGRQLGQILKCFCCFPCTLFTVNARGKQGAAPDDANPHWGDAIYEPQGIINTPTSPGEENPTEGKGVFRPSDCIYRSRGAPQYQRQPLMLRLPPRSSSCWKQEILDSDRANHSDVPCSSPVPSPRSELAGTTPFQNNRSSLAEEAARALNDLRYRAELANPARENLCSADLNVVDVRGGMGENREWPHILSHEEGCHGHLRSNHRVSPLLAFKETSGKIQGR